MELLESLAGWAHACLPPHVSIDLPPALAPIDGDAGFRRYFRLNSRPTLMAVHAPPEHENVPAFVSKDLAFKSGGVHVPTIYAVDFHRGFMLQEDLGGDLLLPKLNAESAQSLYGAAEAELIKIQQVAPDPAVFQPYDQAQLMREMALFPEWFVEKLLKIELDDEDRSLFQQTFQTLVAAALAQPQVVVHRDYHSRNLLLSEGDKIGVIDFQDALVGAFSYDLVSLLKDCYIRWPSDMVRARAESFLATRMRELGHDAVDTQQLVAWFDLMGLQRHIKVLGIFARLWLRDGKVRYLADLPLVLRYTLEVTASYPELKLFDQWLRQRVLPKVSSQHWYRDWRTAGE